MKLGKMIVKDRCSEPSKEKKEINDSADLNSSLDDLSVDKMQYFTEASSINVKFD